ncbi:MAG: putative peptidoglycan glycosyltransferase FtsW [Phycisphaerae bacterium]|nr:putative peptidoglycan glycosyltransferase FtsW [Phycisphaerae bacterium]
MESESVLTSCKSSQDRLAERIAMVVIILMAIGTVFVFSAGVTVRQNFDLRRFYQFPGLRQIIFFPLATTILYSFSYFDYRTLSLEKGLSRSAATWLLAVSAILLVIVTSQRFVVTLPSLVPCINQHYRWMNIPAGPINISFQPSELAKWCSIFFTAGFCWRYRDSLGIFWKRFVPLMAVIGVIAGLVIVEDFGTAAFICLLAFLLLIIAGAKWWHILLPVPFGAAAFIAAIVSSPTRIKRIQAFLNPQELAGSAAYQANQSLIAIGSGGLWGKGLGNGICKYGHLPEDTTDFIFAIICEEMGFVGAATVILLFLIFIWLGLIVVIRCKDGFGRLLAAGIVLAIAVQAALNIGVVTVVLPTKGIPLPFVSAGGTSMLLSAAAVGILMNIAKTNEDTKGLLTNEQ